MLSSKRLPGVSSACTDRCVQRTHTYTQYTMLQYLHTIHDVRSSNKYCWNMIT